MIKVFLSLFALAMAAFLGFNVVMAQENGDNGDPTPTPTPAAPPAAGYGSMVK